MYNMLIRHHWSNHIISAYEICRNIQSSHADLEPWFVWFDIDLNHWYVCKCSLQFICVFHTRLEDVARNTSSMSLARINRLVYSLGNKSQNNMIQFQNQTTFIQYLRMTWLQSLTEASLDKYIDKWLIITLLISVSLHIKHTNTNRSISE